MENLFTGIAEGMTGIRTDAITAITAIILIAVLVVAVRVVVNTMLGVLRSRQEASEDE